MKPSYVLLRGAEYLRRNKWTQNAYARDSKGHPVHPCSEEAVCWDITGALVKGLDGRPCSAKVFLEAVDAVEVLFDRNINCINDKQYIFKEEVIQYIQDTGEYLERRGK